MLDLVRSSGEVVGLQPTETSPVCHAFSRNMVAGVKTQMALSSAIFCLSTLGFCRNNMADSAKEALFHMLIYTARSKVTKTRFLFSGDETDGN